jgi:hypothetical protein
MNAKQDQPDNALADLAAHLLGLMFRVAQAGSQPAEVERAAALYDARKLYPRMTITAPNGGGSIRLELVLCDPGTDEAIVRMFEGEAKAEDRTCH